MINRQIKNCLEIASALLALDAGRDWTEIEHIMTHKLAESVLSFLASKECFDRVKDVN